MALNGWHPGERAVHTKLGHDDDYSTMNLFHLINGDLADDQVLLYTRMSPFVPIVTLDETGRPWSSVLAGENGDMGFVRNPRYSVLQFSAKAWPGDPILDNLEKGFMSPSGEASAANTLVAGIGLDLSTRKREKFAGRVAKYEKTGDILNIDVFVNQAIGNCPKYIVSRSLEPHPNTHPTILHENRHLSPTDRLPEDVIAFILDSDTAFLGTFYQAPPSEAERFPSHLGFNERSGHTGFIRIMPSDGRTLVIPDYSGNRIMTSLGNIEATPVASLTFISYTTGSILYLTGTALNHYPPSSYSIMPFQHTLTTVHTTGYIFVQDALPLRQHPLTPDGETHSPYSPPIRYLAEEAKAMGMSLFPNTHNVSALLTSINVHGPSIATFTWESSEDLAIKPGQAVILNFEPLLGSQKYAHMAPFKPTSLNDDRLRTWTVSSFSPSSASPDGTPRTRTFSLTIREKPGGSVTGAFFGITRKLIQARPALLKDAREMGLKVGVVGVTGAFFLPEVEKVAGAQEISCAGDVDVVVVRKFLWIAGGIGITPFLGMLNGLKTNSGPGDPNKCRYDIALVLSTREPDVLIPLISSALSTLPTPHVDVRLSLHVFSHNPIPHLDIGNVVLRTHTGRVTDVILTELLAANNHNGRSTYVCGPPEFEKTVMSALGAVAGVDLSAVRREEFAY